jgi:putative MATE family efflux protein
VGINASLARSLGTNNKERANYVAGNAKLLYALYYVIILIFGVFFARGFITSQTSDPNVIEMGITYLKIVTIASFGSIGFMCYEKIMQATGKSTQVMVGQLIGAVTNIILDPILIFGYLGLPAMGIKGAAIATVVGQCASCVAIVICHVKANKEITNGLKYMKPTAEIVGAIYKVGAPAILMQALTSFMTYGLNMILGNVSVAAVTAYGIYYKLQNFIFMPVFGLNNASIPIISYNYGAHYKSRIKQTIKCCLIVACSIMLIGTVLFQLIPETIIGMFSLSDEVMALCVKSVKIITIGFVLAGVSIILQGVCQALGNGIYSLIISMSRTVVVVLPLAYVFTKLSNPETAVWYAFPIAELIACVIAVLLAVKIYRSRTKDMPET